MRLLSLRLFAALLTVLSLLSAWQASAAEDALVLATLEWPPYVGASLPHEGLSTYIVKYVATQLGWQTRISYYPWTRAIMMGETGEGYTGYFPSYFSTKRDRECFLSNSLGDSVVGFAYLKDSRFDWADLGSLRGLKLGVVQGYQNGEAFDNMARAGKIRTDVAPTDVSNLRKLLAQRVDAAVIDKSVLRYLLATEPSLQADKERILFHDKELASLSLHICFRRTAEGRAMQSRFNAVLAKTNLLKLENAYFAELDNK
jgi:polar amino acid transport system substrate-binding protein